MNDERWDNLTKMINGKFEVEEEKTIDIPQGDGVGEIDLIIFSGPVGRIKIERYVRPLVLDKKTTYSKRGGSETHVEYVYSENETTQSMRAHKWDDFNDQWEEIKSDNIGEMFGDS